jgi:adenosylcobinamide-GDP ribazoletransferase
MKRLLLALQFLTILPVKIASPVNNADIAGSSAFFPVAGLLQGIVIAGTAYLIGSVFHVDLSIAIILMFLLLSSGGLHLDGLADTFDALAAKSSGTAERDRERRLAIMKDGTSGPMGVAAIVFALALKYLALRDISNLSSFTYYSTLVMLPVLPKWAMVISMSHARPARGEGLGNLFITGTGAKEAGISTILLVILLALPRIFARSLIPAYYPLFYIFLSIALYGLCRAWVHFFDRKFGGLTGDTVGAISEVSEVILLLAVILWSRLSIS